MILTSVEEIFVLQPLNTIGNSVCAWGDTQKLHQRS